MFEQLSISLFPPSPVQPSPPSPKRLLLDTTGPGRSPQSPLRRRCWPGHTDPPVPGAEHSPGNPAQPSQPLPTPRAAALFSQPGILQGGARQVQPRHRQSLRSLPRPPLCPAALQNSVAAPPAQRPCGFCGTAAALGSRCQLPQLA